MNSKLPKVSIIAAISENRALGKDNKLLWHIPEDLKRFKKITKGHPIIMGRKTYESIGRPLPNRTNIVVTRNKDFKADGCVIVHSLQDGIKKAEEEKDGEIFVIGGGQLYKQALPLADKLYLTIVKGDFDADTYFPDYSRFDKVLTTTKGTGEKYKYSFLNLAPIK